MSALIREQHGFLQVSGHSLYVSVYLPGTESRGAALLIEPLGEEKRPAYRMFVRLARRLAESGIAVLRGDLSGYGDSSLEHGQATLDIWRRDAAAMYRELLEQSMCGEASVVSARGGALVASVLSESVRPASWIFLEPVVTGQALLRDLERRESIKTMMGNSETESLPDGAAEYGGLVFSQTLKRELNEVRLADGLRKYPDVPVHCIHVSASAKLPASWPFEPDAVTHVADKPFWGQLDYYESDAVIDAVRNFF